MKTLILLCSAIALIELPANNLRAATQVYDLKTDWSDTQNPNGTWSYRQGETMLANTPFAWAGAGYSSIWPALAIPWPPPVTTIERVSGAVKAYSPLEGLYPGVVEQGDVLMFPGSSGSIRWTAPGNGTIDIAGSAWSADEQGSCFFSPDGQPAFLSSWTLTENGNVLSGGSISASLCNTDHPRSAPDDFSLGSGGSGALHNVRVSAGDQIVLGLNGYPVGVNLTITFTPDSVDPISAIEDLAITVIHMNLQNGMSNSLDSKLDAALNVLTDFNLNNDGAACNSLHSFVNAVQAQRGKKITNVQADQLIASAQSIKTLLNCPN